MSLNEELVKDANENPSLNERVLFYNQISYLLNLGYLKEEKNGKMRINISEK